MFYGCRRCYCRCRCHFASFYLQSMIEFTVALHNAVAKKPHMTIKRAAFTVDIVGFQTDRQLIYMSKALILLKALTMSLSIF